MYVGNLCSLYPVHFGVRSGVESLRGRCYYYRVVPLSWCAG